MDAPRVAQPTSDTADLSTTFAWQTIPDAFDYQVRIRGGDRNLWVVNVGESTSATIPPLPSAYDRSADWPADGTTGDFQIWAFRDPDAVGASELEEPLRRDLLQSYTLGHPIVLSGP